MISTNICAIYFCDYGDYRAVSLENLQPLPSQFYELPYQAIKAKLFGTYHANNIYKLFTVVAVIANNYF
jgi:hypothetical protein